MSDKHNAPETLKAIQRSLGQSIQVPLLIEKESGDYEVQVEKYDILVLEEMVETKTLSGAERLSTYNQQYWFRFLEVMREEYPLLDGILGSVEFNRMVSAYLNRFPSSSPTLRYLSVDLVKFLRNEEHEWKSLLYEQCAAFEFAYIESFDAAEFTPLELGSLDENMLDLNLTFQPHLKLVTADFDLVSMRGRVKREEPLLETEKVQSENPFYWAIYRRENKLISFALGRLQFLLLTYLETMPFGDAFEKLVSELEEKEIQFLAKNVKLWFALWASQSWFAEPEV